MCVKDHGDSLSRFLRREVLNKLYRDARVSGFVNISVYFNKEADNFETAP